MREWLEHILDCIERNCTPRGDHVAHAIHELNERVESLEEWRCRMERRPVSGSFTTTLDFGNGQIGDTKMLTVIAGKTYPLINTFNGLDAAGNAVSGLADAGGTASLSPNGTGGSVQTDGNGGWTYTAGSTVGSDSILFSGSFDGFGASNTPLVVTVQDVPVSGSFTTTLGLPA